MQTIRDTPHPAESRIETAGTSSRDAFPLNAPGESPQGEETGAISVQLTRRIIDGGRC